VRGAQVTRKTLGATLRGVTGLPEWFNWAFLATSVVMSMFYAVKASDAFLVDWSNKPWAWRVHQAWFNLAGSLVGWGLAWLVARGFAHYLELGPSAQPSWSLVALGALAFVGITGHLPFAVAGILQGIEDLARRAAGLLGK
jgi:hypothetical protein